MNVHGKVAKKDADEIDDLLIGAIEAKLALLSDDIMNEPE